MDRRQCFLGLVGLVMLSSVAEAAPSQAASGQALDRTDAEYSLMIGRLTHRRRAGGWWRMRVARARAWGRRGRPGRY